MKLQNLEQENNSYKSENNETGQIVSTEVQAVST